LGSLQLSLVAKISFPQVLAVGVLPFIPGDIIKILLAAIISSRLKGRIKV
jgi:biotin transport system substrate-specific component